ncbi:HU family DNA-binding protein [Facilibium subflavum]|uniref:HU family DNA-binding protein n=1 Tax=Facilibium subflavum TaxID=2219058 RepID=UPI000E650CFB|nr:HU family DNA-binding protein [Facilibium subflavum]
MIKTYNYKEFVQKFSENALIDYDAAEQINQIITDMITDTLIDNNRLEIRGFGSLTPHKSTNRTVRNPKTGQTLTKGKLKRIHFTMAKALRQRLNF